MQHSSHSASDKKHLVQPLRILAATDLHDQDRLIPHIVAQGRASGALITIVHAIQPNQCASCTSSVCRRTAEKAAGKREEEEIAAMVKKIEDQGVSCTTVLKRGFPADIVQEAIDATGATRLIVASSARGKLGQFVLGSVANQLIGRVAIPIFLAGPHAAPTEDHCSPRRILHPVSMKGDYLQSAEFAIQLGALYGAEVTMLHVAQQDVQRNLHTSLALSLADRLFAELVPNRDHRTPQIKVSIAFGDPVDQIGKEAELLNADWIVLGVEEDFSLWPFTESTAYRLLAVAACPVLAIRHQPHLNQDRDAEVTYLAATF